LASIDDALKSCLLSLQDARRSQPASLESVSTLVKCGVGERASRRGVSVIVYLVSQNPEPILLAVQNVGVPPSAMVEVRHVLKAPMGRTHHEQSVVVIDLIHPPAGLQPPLYSADGKVFYVLLVARDQSVALPWVEFRRSGTVEFASVDSAGLSERRFRPLVALLSRLTENVGPERLATVLIARNPWLKDCGDLVCTTLAQPWRIRDPIDLARAIGMLESALRVRCEALGLKRIEHFVTLIRWLAFENLTCVEEMSAKRARLVVGIADPSNFRRQLRRVSYFADVRARDRKV
jgi:hypothetical protein